MNLSSLTRWRSSPWPEITHKVLEQANIGPTTTEPTACLKAGLVTTLDVQMKRCTARIIKMIEDNLPGAEHGDRTTLDSPVGVGTQQIAQISQQKYLVVILEVLESLPDTGVASAISIPLSPMLPALQNFEDLPDGPSTLLLLQGNVSVQTKSQKDDTEIWASSKQSFLRHLEYSPRPRPQLSSAPNTPTILARLFRPKVDDPQLPSYICTSSGPRLFQLGLRSRQVPEIHARVWPTPDLRVSSPYLQSSPWNSPVSIGRSAPLSQRESPVTSADPLDQPSPWSSPATHVGDPPNPSSPWGSPNTYFDPSPSHSPCKSPVNESSRKGFAGFYTSIWDSEGLGPLWNDKHLGSLKPPGRHSVVKV